MLKSKTTNMFALILACFFSLSSLKSVYGANILFMSAVPSPSHHHFNKALALALASQGHNVTMIGNDKDSSIKFHYIHFEGVYEVFHGESVNLNDWFDMSPLITLFVMGTSQDVTCKINLDSKGAQFLFNYPSEFKFDLAIYDITMLPCMYGFIDRFGGPPVIGLTAFLLPPAFAEVMGGHIYPSYYPHYTLQYTQDMSFLQRVNSFILTRLEILIRQLVNKFQQNKVMREKFGNYVRSIEEYEKDMVLLLSNTDPILDYPVSLPPNIIPVGGMHVKPAKPLPEDLQKIVDDSKNVILFALGSNIQSFMLKEETRRELLDALGRLKDFTVIWKYEAELDNVPSNVVIRKWLPQNDILGHPKCKLFISHAGGLSTQETLYHGVPIVGIPGFADQHRNVKKFVSKGLGVQLSFGNLTSDNVYNAIQEVLKNPKYTENIKLLSAMYKDKHQTPMDRALFWVNYVLRHKTAARDKLELPARHMYFYQTSNFDIVAFLALIILSPIFLTSYLICKFKKCCQTKKKHVNRKIKTKLI